MDFLRTFVTAVNRRRNNGGRRATLLLGRRPQLEVPSIRPPSRLSPDVQFATDLIPVISLLSFPGPTATRRDWGNNKNRPSARQTQWISLELGKSQHKYFIPVKKTTSYADSNTIWFRHDHNNGVNCTVLMFYLFKVSRGPMVLSGGWRMAEKFFRGGFNNSMQ